MTAIHVTATDWIAPMPLSDIRYFSPQQLVDYACEDGVLIEGGAAAVSDAIVVRLVNDLTSRHRDTIAAALAKDVG